MLTFVAIIHTLIAIGLVLFVLLQDPKGGAAGVFGGGGGGSNSLFGATGAGNFLTSTTKWLAILFAITCIALTYMTSHRGGSVMDAALPAQPPLETPAAPAPETPEAAQGAAQGETEEAPAPAENTETATSAE